MHINKSVLGEVLYVRGAHGYSVVTLIGATFPTVPIGTVVEMLSLRAPVGLHALALLEEQRNEPKERDINLLLSWEEGSKRYVFSDHEMSAKDASLFNPFVRSNRDIVVIDSQQMVVYCSDPDSHESTDSAWVYKSASMETILLYITKRLTLEELDWHAAFENRYRDELLKLDVENKMLSGSRDFFRTLHTREVEDRVRVTRELEKSKGLYELLRSLPSWLRPAWLHGFFGAMVLLFENQDDNVYS